VLRLLWLHLLAFLYRFFLCPKLRLSNGMRNSSILSEYFILYGILYSVILEGRKAQFCFYIYIL
jgi:hypothetical protein